MFHKRLWACKYCGSHLAATNVAWGAQERICTNVECQTVRSLIGPKKRLDGANNYFLRQNNQVKIPPRKSHEAEDSTTEVQDKTPENLRIPPRKVR